MIRTCSYRINISSNFNNNQFTIPVADKVYNSVTKARIKITTFTSVGSSQNICYLSDFNSNLGTEVKNDLTVFKKSQSVLCAQNLSPAYINLFAQDDAGNALTNQIDSSTQYYRAALEYLTAEDNLVTNGNFDTDSDWTKETGWTISGGTANYSGGSSNRNIRQAIGITDGKTYKIQYEVTAITSGEVACRFGGMSGVNEITATTTGTYVGYITANSSANGELLIEDNDNNFIGSIDNVSVQENPVTLKATEYRFFSIDRETDTPFGFVRFHWLNRAGGIDSYTAKRYVTEGLAVEKNTVEIKSADRTWLQNQYTTANTLTLNNPENYISNTMRGGDLYKGGREILNINANRTNSVFTEPLNKQTADWLQEIITSPNVWIEMDTDATQRNNTANPFQRPSTKGYIPVIINNTEVETLNQDAGLVKFNIEYTLAHKVQTQRN